MAARRGYSGMGVCQECDLESGDLLSVTYLGVKVDVCLGCEIHYDDLSCDRCGGGKSKKARLCRSCDGEARGWPDKNIGVPITRWL